MAVASPRTNAHGADRVPPLGIALLAVVQHLTAVLIVLAPHWFFDNIGTSGADKSHYVGDTAAFQAGLGVALAAALVVPSLRVRRSADPRRCARARILTHADSSGHRHKRGDDGPAAARALHA